MGVWALPAPWATLDTGVHSLTSFRKMVGRASQDNGSPGVGHRHYANEERGFSVGHLILTLAFRSMKPPQGSKVVRALGLNSCLQFQNLIPTQIIMSKQLLLLWENTLTLGYLIAFCIQIMTSSKQC